jgi:hypothetical protein
MKVLKIFRRVLRVFRSICQSTGCHFTHIDSHKWETKMESHRHLAARRDAIL